MAYTHLPGLPKKGPFSSPLGFLSGRGPSVFPSRCEPAKEVSRPTASLEDDLGQMSAATRTCACAPAHTRSGGKLSARPSPGERVLGGAPQHRLPHKKHLRARAQEKKNAIDASARKEDPTGLSRTKRRPTYVD
jgi:hypothetical protein